MVYINAETLLVEYDGLTSDGCITNKICSKPFNISKTSIEKLLLSFVLLQLLNKTALEKTKSLSTILKESRKSEDM